MARTLSVAPSDLLIDEQNPRISQPSAGQHKALQTLARHLDKKLVALAGDIVKHGLDPSNLMIVMPIVRTPTRYVVLEGNRRLAALRVLENPDSVTDGVTESTLKLLRRLNRQYRDEPIESVACLVVPDREAARHWIEMRHTGLNHGAGLMPWGPHETSVFRDRSGGSGSAGPALPPHTDAIVKPANGNQGGDGAGHTVDRGGANRFESALRSDRDARGLSRRETEVVELVLNGCRNKEIADRLSISQETVRVHLRTIFAKLGVHDRTAAVQVALRRGIVHPK